MSGIVISYLGDKDVPAWFRGSSTYQLKASNMLFNAIRDDTEQNTSYRVRQCLIDLGLEPLINDREAKIVIGLSGGNDLAFLWFLMELHYREKNSSYYNVNEQIIMSAIAHLDMVSTLRALDRVLPPGQPTKREIDKEKRMKELVKIKAKQARERRLQRKLKKKLRKESPYFEPLDLPIQIKSRLSSEIPDFHVNFGAYEIWKNPNFIVRNELNRWWGDYELHPGQRIAKALIKDEFLDNFKDVAQYKIDVQEREAKYSAIRNLEKHLEEALQTVLKRDTCLDYFDVDKKNREACLTRVHERLEKDIETYICNFQTMAKKTREQNVLRMITGENDVECHFIDMANEEECCHIIDDKCQQKCIVFGEGPERRETYHSDEEEREGEWYERHKKHSSVTTDEGHHSKRETSRESKRASKRESKRAGSKNAGSKNRKSSSKGAGSKKRSTGGEDYLSQRTTITTVKSNNSNHVIRRQTKCSKRDTDTDVEPNCKPGYFPIPRTSDNKASGDFEKSKAKKKSSLQMSVTSGRRESDGLCNYNYGHDNAATPKTSEHFFIAPGDNLPYMFDYRNIYKVTESEEEIRDIKKKFIKALCSDEHLAKKFYADKTPDMGGAVNIAANKIWRENVAIKTAEMEAEEERIRNLPNTEELDPIKAKYNMDYYDPEDTQLMKSMLKDALALIGQDRRYVLANMPAAYKLVSLFEWISERYGKRYTRRERYKSFKESQDIFSALDKVSVAPPLPNIKKVGLDLLVTYNCRDYILQKGQRVKDEFNKILDAIIMEHSRVAWLAQRAYICSGGPPRDTFFAYMPSRVRDILRFKVWNPTTEFVDAKRCWERRMAKQKAAEQQRI